MIDYSPGMDHITALQTIAADLAAAHDDRRRHTKAADDARARARELDTRRRAAVHRALAAGLTHQQVADALGVTRARVHQLASGD